MPSCSSSSISILISPALMQSGMSLNVPIVLMVICMPGISSSLFVSWLCLDSQSVMNSCTVFLCYNVVFVIVFFGSCVIGLQHFS